MFEQLAFSGTSAPSDSRANGRVGSRPASVQSSLLDVPNLRGEARHSSGLGDEDSRRTGVAAKSRSLRRPEEETHPSREAAKEADPAKGKAKEGVVGAASLGVTSQGRVPRSVLLERWRARMGT